MTNEPQTHDLPEPATREEMMAALFAHMVIQQSNMALMLLGKVPHPQTGETMRDFEAAKMFIDQLEMLEVKTKGNLGKEEETLLKQSLMTLRMTYVEAVDAAPAEQPGGEPKAVPNPGQPDAAPEGSSVSQDPPARDESHKKFSKKY